MLLRVGGANYLPGPRLARWGESASGTRDIVRLAKPAMVRLRDGVGESVHLYVRQRDRRVCVLAVEGSYELRHFSEVGKPLPLAVGASGKVLLAFADPATQALELRRLSSEPPTPRALTREDMVAQLESIRRSGWSMSFGEREEGLAAGAVPIREPDGSVHSALTISGPTARLSAERLRALRPELSGAANEISLALGWSPVPERGLDERRRRAVSRSSAGS
jgi:DNA-binding IclR family transcriptional regulator